MSQVDKVEMKELPNMQQAEIADQLGQQVGLIINTALYKCNDMLNKYGYAVSVTLNFHELNTTTTETNKETQQTLT